jgi:hypothetical protein
MNKNAKQIKSKKAKVITFWSIIGLFTLAFITIVIIMYMETRPFEDYEDIKEADLSLVGQELFKNPQANDYYVYIYTSNINNNKIDTSKAETLKPIIFNYFNFVRLNSRKKNVVKIFGFDVDNYVNKSVVGTTTNQVADYASFKVKEADLPMLIRVTDGEIETFNTAISDIQKSLQTAMDKLNTVTFAAIMPKKKEFLF